ncbi:multiple inositol polyphosphate phosphatase 1-like [Ostrinia furnacalis]|uniref:multiple inositol polyphosphate phosphatase 1-like n=1 Tax=Ostrinia furnacalis TaxID=93504 RepID=UPI00103B17F2|nr:multiple inositol polyphosphate phosphatase 1-like [Ostrinia furnacalis]
MIRHGTRHPISSNLPTMQHAAVLKDDIVRRYLEGRGELCAQDITNLQEWSNIEFISTTPAHLTFEGYKELRDLGVRFHDHFLPLLQDLDQHHFKPTLEQRTIQSAKAFVEGLAQGYLKFEISNATDRDEILRPYFYCTKHNVEVYNGPRSKNELSKYHETPEFQKVLENVQKRTGLERPLSPTNVTGLYDLCRFLRAYSALRTSPWCALFSDEELQILEYLNDIRHYYRNGYGSPINQKLAGPALGELLEQFESSVQHSTKSFTSYFSHDSMIQMMYSALGLFRDYPEISGFERLPDRKWRTSYMTPFAANFASVLHKCTNETGDINHQVQFFINEKEFHLCQPRTCSWTEFKDKFEQFRNSDLEFCNIYNSSTTALKSIIVGL